ncbi:MAG: response regulator, partial [Lachnospira sp.]|nr:response regulator [Lachnospira sp.]
MSSIFQPFSQDVNGANSVIQGTGLGLALVKQIIAEMGGSIEVESELGKGSTFTLTIPYEYRINEQSEDKKEEVKKPESLEDDFSILKGKRILVVEDHPLNQKIIEALLEKMGIVIELAGNGQVAVDLFRSVPENWIDAILMDVRMPLMNGYEATEAIRAMDRNDAKTIPIIAMTANAFEEDIRQSREAGMNE